MIQVCWFALLLLPRGARFIGFFVLVAGELLVPGLAERGASTSWHPGHIAERYRLFTLIVLGESMLAPTVAVQSGLDAGSPLGDLVLVSIGGLLTVFSLWWIYFDHDAAGMLERAIGDDDTTDRAKRLAFTWGYGHYAVFGSAAAIGAGLAVAVDHLVTAGHGDLAEHAALGDTGAALAVTVPVAVFVLCMWVLHGKFRHLDALSGWAFPVVAAMILAGSWTGEPVLLTGLLLAATVCLSIAAGWSSTVADTTT